MGITNLFKIEQDKIKIIFFILAGIITGSSALVLLEPCYEGIGCVVLIPFAIVGSPAIPMLWFIENILFKITRGYSHFYSMPSFIKFIPVILMYLYTFLLGFIISAILIILSFSNEKKERIKHSFKKFATYCIITIILVSGYLFLRYPVAPFVSNERLAHSSIEDYLYYRLENCDGDSAFFLYPLKRNFPKKDLCMISSFIKKKPFKEIEVQGSTYGSSFILTYSGNDTTLSKPINEMDKILFFFKDIIVSSDIDTKKQFCDSFNPSNKIYCVSKLGVSQKENINVDTCKFALAKQEYVANDLQISCFKKYSDFSIYHPSDDVLNNQLGQNWEILHFGSSPFKLLSSNDQSIDLEYEIAIRVRYGEIGKFDDIRINEVSINGPKNTRYYEGAYASITTINNINVYFEEADKSLGDYVVAHFIKGNTYIKINGQYARNSPKDQQKQLFGKIAESIINQ